MDERDARRLDAEWARLSEPPDEEETEALYQHWKADKDRPLPPGYRKFKSEGRGLGYVGRIIEMDEVGPPPDMDRVRKLYEDRQPARGGARR
jgi:hypothetical protein